ncbi:RagB/SusD family nutrient uptake outer membrane protein [Leeuwenhoekiella polynyae]|uniref:Putative outer membrane starch-binding protein n=1 Tax=Leeuwenhoekiella polynyae TaxID=1550906 RepID=A0A4Q0PGU9_9FLAO|nr:RagB/SusD family nutrient uptake outer membrane protein [Leeuwenhoekiella polynyae]RXG26093.1 putative outer membrane starch-binding protein [Leeuwenhoekiella polynyae]
MKNIEKFILAVVFLGTVSCSQDILDKEPKSSFSAQGFYKTTSDAQAGVYGIYASLQSNYRINFAYWGEGRADAVATNHSGDPSLLAQNTLNQTMSSAQWNSLYQTISRANYAIKYVPEVSQGELGLRLVGEARALRALSYFYAVRVWGDVPLIIEPFESAEQDLFVERTDKELVLDQIVEDLKFAAENCNTNFGGERDRVLITQGGANALLTQVYMWRKDYQNAALTADLVLDNSLYSLVSMADWSNIFTTGFSNESIFEVGYNDVQTNALRVLYALGSDSDYFPSEQFRNSFEDGDLRQTKIYDTTAAQPRKIWKYFGEGFNDESPDPSSNNIVLVRLADIILLKAEALNELGQTDEALDLLNRIRTRAGLPDLDEADAIAAYGDVQSAILHERSIELSYEGHRWFDLLRTDKAIEVMQPINGLSDAANLVWPIHEDALNRNPNLDQNSFYQ